mmetsp:Transcript_30454/g.70222  ORF Transcript_30454/g.70222 Transcript_30454/m.70222 type:complete len:307 (-) Transcript_30454:2371-3291(-)
MTQCGVCWCKPTQYTPDPTRLLLHLLTPCTTAHNNNAVVTRGFHRLRPDGPTRAYSSECASPLPSASGLESPSNEKLGISSSAVTTGWSSVSVLSSLAVSSSLASSSLVSSSLVSSLSFLDFFFFLDLVSVELVSVLLVFAFALGFGCGVRRKRSYAASTGPNRNTTSSDKNAGASESSFFSCSAMLSLSQVSNLVIFARTSASSSSVSHAVVRRNFWMATLVALRLVRANAIARGLFSISVIRRVTGSLRSRSSRYCFLKASVVASHPSSSIHVAAAVSAVSMASRCSCVVTALKSSWSSLSRVL